MNKCEWTEPWSGSCSRECEGHFCDEHAKLKCRVCGKQAVGRCPSSSSLMCGEPLCEACACPLHGDKAVIDQRARFNASNNFVRDCGGSVREFTCNYTITLDELEGRK